MIAVGAILIAVAIYFIKKIANRKKGGNPPGSCCDCSIKNSCKKSTQSFDNKNDRCYERNNPQK